MRWALVLLAVGCGSAVAEENVSHAQTAAPVTDGCETNLDAGTLCEPCPGNSGSRQFDVFGEGGGAMVIPLPDGGTASVLTWRQCDCPDSSKHVQIVWRSCPPIPAGFNGRPATTCAEIATEFAAACR